MSPKIGPPRDLKLQWKQALKTNSNGEGRNKVSPQELEAMTQGIFGAANEAMQEAVSAYNAGKPADVVQQALDKAQKLENLALPRGRQLEAMVDLGIRRDKFETDLKPGFLAAYADKGVQSYGDFVKVGVEAATKGPEAFRAHIHEMSLSDPADRAALSALLQGLLGKTNKTFTGFESTQVRDCAQMLVDMGIPVSKGAERLLKDLGIKGNVKNS